MLKFLKWLHPKNHCSDNKIVFIGVIFLVSLISMFISIPVFNDFKYKQNILNISDNIIYTVNYRQGKGTIGSNFEFNYNNKTYKILCDVNINKVYLNELQKICNKKNNGKEFLGSNMICFEFDYITGNKYMGCLIKSGEFLQNNCQNCDITIIDIPENEIDKYVNKLRNSYLDYVIVALLTFIYLFFQIKFRFFNKP